MVLELSRLPRGLAATGGVGDNFMMIFLFVFGWIVAGGLASLIKLYIDRYLTAFELVAMIIFGYISLAGALIATAMVWSESGGEKVIARLEKRK